MAFNKCDIICRHLRSPPKMAFRNSYSFHAFLKSVLKGNVVFSLMQIWLGVQVRVIVQFFSSQDVAAFNTKAVFGFAKTRLEFYSSYKKCTTWTVRNISTYHHKASVNSQVSNLANPDVTTYIPESKIKNRIQLFHFRKTF